MPQFIISKYKNLLKYAYGLLFAVFAGIIIAKTGAAGGFLLIAAPLVFAYFFFFFKHPKLGLYTVLLLSFFIATLGRYVPVQIPFGLGIDIILALSYVVVLFKNWKKTDLSASYNDVTLLMLIWMAYVTLQIVNPLASSFLAWFYSMRGVALYQLLWFGLTFTLLNSKKDLYRFLNIWLALSLLGAIWAMKQKFFGLDSYEQAWLDAGAYETHLLWGTKLRHFSYYFDAGIFGAAMGHIMLISGILFLGPFSLFRRVIYFLTTLLCFYALMISGTRGALAVPGIGGILFLILTKNVRLLSLGGGVLLAAFVFLKFTTIAQSNYDIARLRSSLSPDDPSLQVRLINREYLSKYLADKPFGTGLGTAGFWGRRFSPNTWMANFETDGLYTRIRAETGRVGHTLFVWMWIYILIRACIITWKFKDPEKKYLAMAFVGGYAGVLVANYGNSIMSQFPINFLTFASIAFVFVMKYWDEDGNFELPEKEKDNIMKY